MTVQPTKKGEWRHLSEQAAIGLIENLAANEHVINDEVLRRIQRDLDLAEARLTGD
jgi:hypothetical protein